MISLNRTSALWSRWLCAGGPEAVAVEPGPECCWQICHICCWVVC
jgi:hypothetical protein